MVNFIYIGLVIINSFVRIYDKYCKKHLYIPVNKIWIIFGQQ